MLFYSEYDHLNFAQCTYIYTANWEILHKKFAGAIPEENLKLHNTHLYTCFHFSVIIHYW